MRDINLLPDEVRSQDVKVLLGNVESNSTAKTKTIIMGVIIVTFMAALILFPKIYINLMEAKKNSIDIQMAAQKYVQIKTLKAQLTNIKSILKTKEDVIQSIDERNYPVSEMISMMKHVAPSGSTINRFDYNEKTLKVSVSMKDLIQVAEFVSNAKRYEFLTPSDSMKEISYNKDGTLEFTFDVGRKDGN